ncbi:MAG: ABC transporter permease [bacterium]
MGELRHSLRLIRKNPGTSLSAILSLVIGITLTSVVFSVVDWLWLESTPFGEPERVVRVFTQNRDGELKDFSWPAFTELQRQAETLEGVTAVEHRGALYTDSEGVTRMLLADVTARNFFELVRLRPAAGRFYGASDPPEVVGERGVVISHALWERAFGSDPSIIGRSLSLSGRSHPVAGVAPEAFTGIRRMGHVDVWFPPRSWGDPDDWTSDFPSHSVLGRMLPGTDIGQVQAEMSTIVDRLDIRDRATRTPMGAVVMTDAEYQTRTFGDTGTLLLALVVAVLLIACANVAGLLLAKALVRQREMAVRMAVGGSRGRIVRQLLSESLVLSGLAVAVSLGLAALILDLLPALLPPQPTYRAWGFALDGRVVAFTGGVALLTAFLFGLLPALRASRPDLIGVLRGDGRDRGRQGSGVTGLKGMVVLQLALSLVLVSTTGLLYRSFLNARSADLGFERKDVLVSWMIPRMDREEARDFYRGLVPRIRVLPGVERASMARVVPFFPSGSGASMEVSTSRETGAGFTRGSAIKFNLVGPEYFDILGIPLLRGRPFTTDDRTGGPRVAVVNQTMARRLWPAEDPLGQVFRTDTFGEEPIRVVGVAADSRYNDIEEEVEPYFYLPFTQMSWGETVLLAETSGPPAALAGAVRREILGLAPDIWTLPMTTLEELVRNATYDRRVIALALGVFTLLGLMLAGVGLYGVSVYTVNRRVREIGIRMALGADSSRIVQLILKQGGRLVVAGLAVGIPLTVGAAMALRGSLYGVRPLDPVNLAAAAALLAAVTLAAVLLPGRRALGVDPMRVMREE